MKKSAIIIIFAFTVTFIPVTVLGANPDEKSTDLVELSFPYSPFEVLAITLSIQALILGIIFTVLHKKSLQNRENVKCSTPDELNLFERKGTISHSTALYILSLWAQGCFSVTEMNGDIFLKKHLEPASKKGMAFISLMWQDHLTINSKSLNIKRKKLMWLERKFFLKNLFAYVKDNLTPYQPLSLLMICLPLLSGILAIEINNYPWYLIVLSLIAAILAITLFVFLTFIAAYLFPHLFNIGSPLFYGVLTILFSFYFCLWGGLNSIHFITAISVTTAVLITFYLMNKIQLSKIKGEYKPQNEQEEIIMDYNENNALTREISKSPYLFFLNKEESNISLSIEKTFKQIENDIFSFHKKQKSTL